MRAIATGGAGWNIAYRAETTVSEDGTVSLELLPFGPGEKVEVIILATARLLECPLSTADEMIREYPHVETLPR